MDATALENEALDRDRRDASTPTRSRRSASASWAARRAAAGAPRGARPRNRDDAERAPASGSRTALDGRRETLERPTSTGGWRGRIDVTLPGEAPRRGHLHLITQIRREVEDIFLGLGYQVVDGREVETTHYNFDGLNFPPGHPARSPLQTLFLDDETVLRTETSPSQIRTMEAQQPPIYIVSLGRVYRRDTPDATHTPTSTRSKGSPSTRGSRSRTSRARSTTC